MNLIWYVYYNNIVSGPFSTENVETGLEQNKWSDQSMIWWKGQREWISVQSWRENLAKILESLKTNFSTIAWYVEYLGTQKGPMNSKELYQFTQANGIISTCRVWAEGMDKWMSIYEVPDLIDFFGITRRKHPRAPIKGEILIKKNETLNDILFAQAGSISSGGLGVRGLDAVHAGESINVMLKSPLLVNSVQTEAKVVYSNPGGFTGLEFKDLNQNEKSIIDDYVKQFKL